MPSHIGQPLPRKVTINIYFLAATGFALVSSWGAITGSHGWGLTIAAAIAATVFLALPWLTSGGTETVQVDESGVLCSDGKIHEQIKWVDVKRVRILTTEGGPFAEDVFFLLESGDGTGCCVSHSAAVRTGLLEAIHAHLPGANDEAVIQAMSCTSKNSFLIWEKS